MFTSQLFISSEKKTQPHSYLVDNAISGPSRSVLLCLFSFMRTQMVFTEQEGHEQAYYKEQIEPKLSDGWRETKHIFAYETNEWR